ncbi:MAG: glutathione S-transferase [Pseudomonadota bacterium]
MELFYAKASPFVRKVMVVLHETGQLEDVTLLDTALTPISQPDALKPANPLSKVPALARPDGPALYDSRVICAYLDDRARAGLYGTDAERWDILTLEATGDGIMDAAVVKRYEEFLRPAELHWQDWLDGQWAKVDGALRAVNDRWMAHLSQPLNMAHISIGCAIGYLDFRHDIMNWRASAPELADWYTGFSQRPSMQATRPDT